VSLLKISQSLSREALYNFPFIFQKYVWLLKVIGANRVITKTISDSVTAVSVPAIKLNRESDENIINIAI